jgi:hypothetical protein
MHVFETDNFLNPCIIKGRMEFIKWTARSSDRTPYYIFYRVASKTRFISLDQIQSSN